MAIIIIIVISGENGYALLCCISVLRLVQTVRINRRHSADCFSAAGRKQVNAYPNNCCYASRRIGWLSLVAPGLAFLTLVFSDSRHPVLRYIASHCQNFRAMLDSGLMEFYINDINRIISASLDSPLQWHLYTSVGKRMYTLAFINICPFYFFLWT